MPFVLLIIGELLVVTGIQGTEGDFYKLLESDFTGNNSFIYWLLAIALIGALGYVPGFKSFSNAFLLLVLVVLILHQNPSNLFQNITGALKTSTKGTASGSSNVTNAGYVPSNNNTASNVNTALNLASAFGLG